ncbi:heme-degrading domain-containing protein [Galbitalea sp. SE-J8]|uniref:heme-degrading domain-containing protein n=1 Tax=Galbitalea sp. SE-J8 TaxID=3054952 RepID=UPI00259CDB1E|nr:heme-degrading domain-containing protein [Galbitalea sp. SE-J8]MDM4764003.1 heme-degrading domain-containing protein [Galbitalea sp. SE-J8]
MTDDIAALIARLEAERDTLLLDRFTNADAWALGSWLVRAGTERSLGIAVDIRRGDQQLFHAALAGTTADNDDWIERKVRTVRRFAEASYLVGRRFAARGLDFNEKTGLPFTQYVAHGGCVPIVIRDVGPVGTVTVSGLAQHDDHALAVEALRVLQESR